MEQFNDHYNAFEGSFERFERAAVKGHHEESIWILSVVKDVERERTALQEAFAQTGEPLGWYFAGKCSSGREQFDFWKKSAEGGCSWGQVAYGRYFEYGQFVEKDKKMYVEWLEKAANQNNPEAIYELGYWFLYGGGNKEEALSYFRAAAELGWKNAMYWLGKMLKEGEGCEKDLRQAVIWSAKGTIIFCWKLLEDARQALESRATDDLDYDFNQLCYSLGWGLYWYEYGSEDWNKQFDENMVFGEQCLDYYCSCVELQQKSIFTFRLFWNRTTGRVREPGRIIAQMVWEGRETNVLLRFGEKQESWGCILF
jgi:tetratricopeptide (TPR) repeat protein